MPVPAAPQVVPSPPSPAPISASGGTEFTADGYNYHVWQSDSTFTVSSECPMEIEYFLVGGGGGGSDRGLGTGGGGAGGVLTNMPLGTTTPDAGHARLGNPDYRVSPGSYTVKVGSGGVGGADNTLGQGEPSEFYPTPVGDNHPDGLRAFGGGFGGYSMSRWNWWMWRWSSIIITKRSINQSRALQVKQYIILDLMHKDFLVVTVTHLAMAVVVEQAERDKMRCLALMDHMVA